MIPQAHFPTCNSMTEAQAPGVVTPPTQQGRVLFSNNIVRYTDAFKVAAIRQAVASGAVAQTASDLGVSKASIFNWCRDNRLLIMAGQDGPPKFKIGRRPFRNISDDSTPPWREDAVVQSAPFSSTLKAAEAAQNYAAQTQNATPFNMCFCPGCGLNLSAAQTALTAMLQEQ